jgi:hypothetical protein
MVGTHSQCLKEWENPIGRMSIFFLEAKIIHTNRGPKKEDKNEEVVFFYGKVATLSWDPNRR